MSRAGNLVGSFVIEDRGSTERRPWTEVDEDRLRGRYVHRFRNGEGVLQPPHVDTPSGPFFVGSVKLVARVVYRRCPDCGERKVRRVDRQTEAYQCDACGRSHSLQYVLSFPEVRP